MTEELINGGRGLIIGILRYIVSCLLVVCFYYRLLAISFHHFSGNLVIFRQARNEIIRGNYPTTCNSVYQEIFVSHCETVRLN